jgi:hypothetical protein
VRSEYRLICLTFTHRNMMHFFRICFCLMVWFSETLPMIVLVSSSLDAQTFSWDFPRIFWRYVLSGKRSSCRQWCANGDFGNLWIYWRCALSGKRCSRRQRGVNGDLGNLQICRMLSPSYVLIRVGFVSVCSYGWACVRVVSICVVLPPVPY